MKTTLLFLCTVLVTCCNPYPHVLVVGHCYYYHRPTKHPNGWSAEKLNPFYYRVDGRKGRNVVMHVEELGWVGRLLDGEKRLVRYSEPCSCDLVRPKLSTVDNRQ